MLSLYSYFKYFVREIKYMFRCMCILQFQTGFDRNEFHNVPIQYLLQESVTSFDAIFSECFDEKVVGSTM